MTAAARKTVPNAPIEFVVAKLGLQLKRQGRELVGPCPVCGGHDRFAVSIAKQLWNCRGCSKGGDGIGLIRHVEGCSYREAVTLLKDDEVRTFTAPVRVQPAVDPQIDERRRIDLAGQVWTQASPLGPEATTYFERRGIDINAVPERGGLRFHRHCPWEDSTKPCVIARYTTAIGNDQRGIWRRPISGEKPKALGAMHYGIYRRYPLARFSALRNAWRIARA
jgi:hypothetical protein